jgi:histidinol dehydrogenase
MDDSGMYTGVDEPVGVFGNEKKDKETQRKLQEQDQKLKEITPKIQQILDTVETERQIAVEFITNYIDNTKDTDTNVIAELKAAARYRKYLDELKTKFTLALRDVRKKDD